VNFPEYFEFRSPARVMAGPGIADNLSSELADLGVRRVFVISDRILASQGLLGSIISGLGKVDVELFTDVPENSDIAVCEHAATRAAEFGADAVLAAGGGSVLDTGKAVGLLLGSGGRLLDYQGVGVIPPKRVPVIAVPTTAGTGSEVTPFAIIRDARERVKISFNSPHLVPTLAVLDPGLTFTMPPRLTASTGIDALTHAIEAFVSTQSNPVTDTLALYAISLVFKHLPVAVASGFALEARYAMLVAANLAGLAFANALVGCVHAMAHAVGGLFGIPHGIANGILLPVGMEFNLPAVPERMSEIARASGRDALPENAPLAVRQLLAECSLPTRLKDVGVPEDGLLSAASVAALEGCLITNPREATEEEILAMLKTAYD